MYCPPSNASSGESAFEGCGASGPNSRIDERISAAGGRVERVALGSLHEGIAAEPWKHVHTAFGGWIDAVVSAAVLARLVAEMGLTALRAPVSEELGRLSRPAKDAAMDRLRETLPEAFPAATASFDHGVRLTLPDGGWTLVRPSGTEPYVRVYAESESVDDLIASVREAVETAVADAR